MSEPIKDKEAKTALTVEEKIKAAYLHYVRHVSQQDIAVAFEVNSGRVNEACKALMAAALGADSGPVAPY